MNRLDFRVRYDSQNVFSQIKSVERSLFTPEADLPQSQRLMQECIYKAEPKPPLYQDNELGMEFLSKGMQRFNDSQKEAIKKACRQRVTLVQGPPGTGKTKVLAGIVANMCLQHPGEQILVATSMNFTADLVA